MTKHSPASPQLLKSRESLRRLVREIAIREAKKGLPVVGDDFVKFNEMIGLPKLPSTLKPSPILDYQLEYANSIINKLRVILNKSRKIGATETALRTIAYQCYHDYMGHNVIIVAGNRQPEANVFLERFQDLFIDGWTDMNGKKWKYGDLVMTTKSDRMDLYSGVTIRTIPANPRALRGQANVRCVFFSEAAHINSLDDSRIWGAVKPIVANDDYASIIVESTPNGLRGFFHDEFHNIHNGFTKLTFDYKVALGKLFSQKFIDQEMKDPRPWYFDQEYRAMFVAGGSQAIKLDTLKFSERPLVSLDD